MIRKVVLAAVLVLVAGGAQASSYQLTDGTVVDPIQSVFGGNISYSGPNLEPGVNLIGYLGGALLHDADLTNASLLNTSLFGADLSGANLTNALMQFTNLGSANLTGAILQFPPQTTGAAPIFYDALTNFTGTGFDPVAAGWVLRPIPEPSTALLLGLGLVGMAARRRA